MGYAPHIKIKIMHKTKKKRVRKIGPPLAPATQSTQFLVQVPPSQVGMFRFLLEAYEHIAYFSVINKQKALLKIVCSPHREQATRWALDEIGHSMEVILLPWPFSITTGCKSQF